MIAFVVVVALAIAVLDPYVDLDLELFGYDVAGFVGGRLIGLAVAWLTRRWRDGEPVGDDLSVFVDGGLIGLAVVWLRRWRGDERA